MTDIKSTPELIARTMGWDFTRTTSLEALAAWEAYREVPLNAGTYTDEQDAFTSGFDAAPASPLVAAIHALVAAQTTANRIAWTTRPGYAPGPAVREWIEREVGL